MPFWWVITTIQIVLGKILSTYWIMLYLIQNGIYRYLLYYEFRYFCGKKFLQGTWKASTVARYWIGYRLPDRMPARMLAWTLNYISERLREVFNASVETGRFSGCFKSTNSAYRPIMLLNEAVIGLRGYRGTDVLGGQFCFWLRRSTVDTILRLTFTLAESQFC